MGEDVVVDDTLHRFLLRWCQRIGRAGRWCDDGEGGKGKEEGGAEKGSKHAHLACMRWRFLVIMGQAARRYNPAGSASLIPSLALGFALDVKRALLCWSRRQQFERAGR